MENTFVHVENARDYSAILAMSVRSPQKYVASLILRAVIESTPLQCFDQYYVCTVCIVQQDIMIPKGT